MTTFIYYKSNPINFVQLLVSIQPQLHPDNDDLYIVDASPGREGLRLTKLYGSSRSFIFVEVGDYDWDKAFSFAYQNMLENKQDGILSLSENLVISRTLISNIKKAGQFEFDVIVPMIIETPYKNFPSSFSWYNPVVKKALRTVTLPSFCFYKKAKSKGATIGIITEEAVVLLP